MGSWELILVSLTILDLYEVRPPKVCDSCSLSLWELLEGRKNAYWNRGVDQGTCQGVSHPTGSI